MRPGPRVTSEDGAVLSTRLHGDLTAPRLLLQHGVGSSCTYLDEAVAPSLVTAGWCVVVADLRGHGAASPVRDAERHHLDRYVEDVAALATAVGVSAVGGVSAGAHAAVAAVARGAVEAVRVLAVLPAWTGRHPAGEGTGSPHAAVAAEVRRVGVAGMVERLRTEPGILPWLRRVLVRDMAAGDRPSVEAALLALDGGRAPTRDEVASLPCPLAVVGWPGDPGHPLAVAEDWAAAAPDATLVTTSLEAPDQDQFALGRAAAEALGPPPL